VTAIDAQTLSCVEDLLEVDASLVRGDAKSSRLLLVDEDGRESATALRLDRTFWPTVSLTRDPKTRQWLRTEQVLSPEARGPVEAPLL